MSADDRRLRKLLVLYAVAALVFAASITGGYYATALFSDGESVGIQFTASATAGNAAGNTDAGTGTPGNADSADGASDLSPSSAGTDETADPPDAARSVEWPIEGLATDRESAGASAPSMHP